MLFEVLKQFSQSLQRCVNIDKIRPDLQLRERGGGGGGGEITQGKARQGCGIIVFDRG